MNIKSISIAIVFTIFVINQVYSQAQEKPQKQSCIGNLQLTTPEEEIYNIIDGKLKENAEIDKDCFFQLIQRGYFSAAKLLYENYYLANDRKSIPGLKDKILQIKREIDSLNNILSYENMQQIQEMQPIYQWGQSKNNVLIFIKFSKRIDSPAYSNIKDIKVNYTEDTLSLAAISVESHRAIRIKLNLDLYEKIIPELSTYKSDQVGTIMVNLTKAVVQPATPPKDETLPEEPVETETETGEKPKAPEGEDNEEEKKETEKTPEEKREEEKEERKRKDEEKKAEEKKKKEHEQNQIWRRLLKDANIKTPIWWEARSLYQRDMDEYFELLEADRVKKQNEEEKIEKELKAQKKLEKQKLKQQKREEKEKRRQEKKLKKEQAKKEKEEKKQQEEQEKPEIKEEEQKKDDL